MECSQSTPTSLPEGQLYPAERIARLLGGTLRNGRGEFLCPVHGGRCLNVKDGRDHSALIYCWGRCSLTSILAELGLTKRDLFVSSAPLSREQLRAAVTARARQERLKQGWAEIERGACKWVRDAMTRHGAAAEQLATLPDDSPCGDRLAELYHQTLDHLRAAELLADRILAAKVRL